MDLSEESLSQMLPCIGAGPINRVSQNGMPARAIGMGADRRGCASRHLSPAFILRHNPFLGFIEFSNSCSATLNVLEHARHRSTSVFCLHGPARVTTTVDRLVSHGDLYNPR